MTTRTTQLATEPELEARIAALRESSPDSQELADAILDFIHTQWFKPAIAEPLIDEVLVLCEQIGYRLGRVRALIPKAFSLYIRTKYVECLPVLAEALPLIIEHGTSYEYGRAMLMLAATSQTSGAYDKALEYAFRLLEADEEDRDEELTGWMHYRVADIYHELGDAEQMLQHAQACYDCFLSLLERSDRIQHRIGMGRARTQLAAANQKAGKIEQALSYNEIALKEYRDVADRLGETRALTDIGRLHLIRGQSELAEQYLQEGLDIRREVGHRGSQTSSLLELGKLYLEKGDTDKATEVLEEGLLIAEELNIKKRAYEIRQELSLVFKSKGDLGKALEQYEQFHALKEEVAGEAMSLKIHNRKVLAEIDRAERDAEIERAKNEQLKSKNKELANLLAELRSTQDRLIQSEKMASLGQLTAGIAHEIRNPLNFVNNFSALSVDVAADMAEALNDCSDQLEDAQRVELQDGLETLIFNTTRIKEHGARAEKIVASMIEHSRGGNREPVVVDLNEMVEEYVVLAYHALMAGGNRFTVYIDRNYDPMAGPISLVVPEIGKVLVNLIGNAFDALRVEGVGRKDEGTPPTIMVSTSRIGSSMEIRVSDNGPGIPHDVQSKIFEPFFTTKPTGTGTGLGLSMSYDIVTKGHGGEMKVVSAPGRGAAFVIRLPA